MAIGNVFAEPAEQTYLEAAKAAADWLGSIAIETPDGKTWPKQTKEAIDEKEFMGELSFYSGTTGIVYFFLQIGRFLQDQKYLSLAVDGGRFIVANWEREKAGMNLFGIQNSNWGLSNGGAGIAFLLNELGKYTGETAFIDFAKKISGDIFSYATNDGSGPVWSGQAGVVADSGIILFLLYASKEFNEPTYQQLAVAAGKRILTLGRKHDTGGVFYLGLDTSLVGIPSELQLPNFELGTAGIAYTFARLYEDSRLIEFLQAAEAGAEYIRSIAVQSGDAALVPHHLPDPDDIYYLGYCHGPAGTGRLFYLLYQLTKKETHKEWYEKLANGIIKAGAPEQHSTGYWNVVSQCCGASAILHFFLGLWASTNDQKYLQIAERSANHILHEGVAAETGARWFQAWARVEPWHVTSDTGYFNGTAGIGAALLEFYQAKTENYNVDRMVDDPFPKIAGSPV